MMKLVSICFVLFPLFLIENLALDAESYIAFIEERSRDENFVEEYTKWSSKLLSQPGYLFGISHAQFPCSINDSNSIPTSVHALRPSDIKCIGAMGDSFTTGLGARGTTPIDLLSEDLGISWSVGGDYTYSQIPTIPNILRKYNSTLKGFSTKGYVMSPHTQHTTNNQLNAAKSGGRSIDMPYQASFLIRSLQNPNKSICDWKNDWKMITIFIGANDLCHFCDNPNETNYTPERYLTNIRLALDKLYNASIPRTLINLVLPPDIRGFKEFNNDSYICQTLLQKICPCAAFPTEEQAKILDDYIPRYQELLKNLTNSGRYDDRDDFTVVIQPFMAKTQLPYQNNGTIDFSYLSPDCFHFSGKGHSQAAMSLWNNMLEPIGIKHETWNINESLKCPTKEYPYIFTSKNSAKALEELTRKNTVQPTSNTTIIPDTNFTSGINTTDNYTYINTSTIQTNNTSMINSSNNFPTINVNTTVVYAREHRKDKKSRSDSSLSKTKLVAIAGFSFILIMILIVGIMRRRKRFTLIPQSGDVTTHQVSKFNRLDEESDDDMDLYTRPTAKSDYSDNTITKTHGTRMPLD